MEFFLFFVISILFLKSTSKYSNLSLIKTCIVCLPFMLMWCLICGGQYCIGTDYLGYLSFFKGMDLDKMLNDGEFGLPWFVYVCNNISFEGQDLFFILALIWCILFLFFCLEFATTKYFYLYFFFFVTVTNFFNNQLNGIRQATAVYLCTTAFLLFLNRAHFDFRIKHIFKIICDKHLQLSVIFMFLSVMWHRSAFFMLLMIPFLKEYRFYDKKNVYYIYLLGCVAGTILISDDLLMNIVGRIDIYSNFLESEYMLKKMNPINVVVRYLNLIPYLISIHFMSSYNLSKKQKIFYFLGIVSEGIILLSITNSLIVRFAAYFQFLSIFPLIVLADYLKTRKKVILYRAICVYYFLFYSYKVLFWAQGEYRFDSVFYNYFKIDATCCTYFMHESARLFNC